MLQKLLIWFPLDYDNLVEDTGTFKTGLVEHVLERGSGLLCKLQYCLTEYSFFDKPEEFVVKQCIEKSCFCCICLEFHDQIAVKLLLEIFLDPKILVFDCKSF